MVSKHSVLRVALYLVLLGLVTGASAFAGSAVVGSVAGSMDATVGGQTLLPNTTLFSGDNLQVKDGVAVVALGNASRIVLGRDTAASFLRDSDKVTVLLNQGSVSLYRNVKGTAVRAKIGDVTVTPVSGFKTLGEVAMLNGAVLVTAKDGMLRVDGNGSTVNVAKGKTITVVPRNNAPQGGGGVGGGRCCGGGGAWPIIAAGAGAGALVVAAIAVSRAGKASDNANSAASDAAAAAAAAAAATAAANSAAAAAAAAANSVGCALNILANGQGQPSPYTPPTGQSCM